MERENNESRLRYLLRVLESIADNHYLHVQYDGELCDLESLVEDIKHAIIMEGVELMTTKSNTLLYVTFKEYPELGRMRVVEGETVCKDCHLFIEDTRYIDCKAIHKSCRNCISDNYHFEACPKEA